VGHGVEQLPVWQVIARPVRPIRIVRRVRGLVVATSRGVLHELLAIYDVVEVGLLGALGLPLLVQPLDFLKVLDEAVLDRPIISIRPPLTEFHRVVVATPSA